MTSIDILGWLGVIAGVLAIVSGLLALVMCVIMFIRLMKANKL